MEHKRIRFWSKVAWLYSYVVKSLQQSGFVYGVDMQGYKPKQDASYLEFYNDDAYEQAKKYFDIMSKDVK